jgi:hypothetical protein
MEGPPDMGKPPAGLGEGGRVHHCEVEGEWQPSDFESTVQIRTYPFAGKIHKETLSFLVINPRSIAYC